MIRFRWCIFGKNVTEVRLCSYHGVPWVVHGACTAALLTLIAFHAPHQIFPSSTMRTSSSCSGFKGFHLPLPTQVWMATWLRPYLLALDWIVQEQKGRETKGRDRREKENEEEEEEESNAKFEAYRTSWFLITIENWSLWYKQYNLFCLFLLLLATQKLSTNI